MPSYEQKILELNAEIDHLKTRLSRVIGSKITDSNPNIADLSDENRPTKLAEQFSELYDNEWSDAFEWMEREKEIPDDTITDRLLQMLTEIFTICLEKATNELQTVENDIVKFLGDNEKPDQVRSVLKELKESRKKYSTQTPQSLIQKSHLIAAKLIPNFDHPDCVVRQYVHKAAYLCWLMAIQDPPVYMDTRPARGDEFSKQVYREYTSKGKTLDYVVWPPLYICEGGDLLVKGVAEPQSAVEPQAEHKTGQKDPPSSKEKIKPNECKSEQHLEAPVTHDDTYTPSQSARESVDEQGPERNQEESINNDERQDSDSGTPHTPVQTASVRQGNSEHSTGPDLVLDPLVENKKKNILEKLELPKSGNQAA